MTSDQWRVVQGLGSLTLGLAALLYAVGVLIVNLDYARFGLADFGVLRTRYVAVGVTFVALLLTPVGVGYASRILTPWSAFDRGEDRRRDARSAVAIIAKGAAQIVGGAGLGVVVTIAAVGTAFETTRLEYARWAWPFIGWMTLAAATGVALKVSVNSHRVGIERDARDGGTFADDVASGSAIILLFGILLAGATVTLYAREIYPHIPQGMGGGRPEFVIVYPAPAARDDLEKMLEAARSDWTALLLDESESTYVLGMYDRDLNVTAVVSVPRASLAGLRRVPYLQLAPH